MGRDQRECQGPAGDVSATHVHRTQPWIQLTAGHSALPSLEQELFSTAPIYKSIETVTLADSLAQMRDALGAENPVVRKVLNGKTPEDAAKDLIANTKLDDVSVRKQLYQGGTAAVVSSNDPLIALMREIDPDAREVRKQYDDKVDAAERRAGAAINRTRFAHSGFNHPPDATFTLRLSYGAVKGYVENGKKIPYFTTFAGGFEHAAEHGNQPPYKLPESWTRVKSSLNLATRLNRTLTDQLCAQLPRRSTRSTCRKATWSGTGGAIYRRGRRPAVGRFSWIMTTRRMAQCSRIG